MKRYEPAGGVCVLQWHAGAPSETDKFGKVLLETWTPKLSMWTFARPVAIIQAHIRAAQWKDKAWRLFDGEAFDEVKHGYVRRWCRLATNRLEVSAKIGDWR